MRNLTITIEEDVARWARVWAAREDTSVSRLVGQILKERMLRELGYESAMEQYCASSAKPLKKKEDAYPAREEIYERSHIRGH
jgi:hypothetical protein